MNEFCKFIKKYSCKIIISLCILIILLSLYNSGVLSESFQISPNDTTPTIVLFHADWCGHCKKLMPDWLKFEKDYHNQNGISVINLESDEHKELTKKHNITGFPTIKYCPNGIHDTSGTVPYEGSRNLPGLVEFHGQFSEKLTENFEGCQKSEEGEPEEQLTGYDVEDYSNPL